MNPFYLSTFSRPGMNFSFSNYEMTNGSLQSSMNCFMNQAWADMAARRELYYYPQYSFNNFSEYQTIFNNNYLTDINYTLGRYHFNSVANGGQGLYGWNAVPTFNNQANQWSWTPWGWQGPQGGGAASGSGNDSEFKTEYEALKVLLETYRDKAGSKTKSAINDALNKSGSYEEKLKALKDVYKKLNKDNVRKTIALLPEYKAELEKAGYKFGGNNSLGHSVKTLNVQEIHSAIDGIKDSADEYCPEIFADIAAYATMDDSPQNNILAIVSKWNDQYKDSSNKGSIIDFVISKKTDKNKDNVYAVFVTPLTTALTAKADQVLADSNCDSNTVEAVNKLVADLNKAVENKQDSNVKTNFKKLYAILRDIEAKRISNLIREQYAFLNDIADDDTDFINANIIVSETKQDLKDEGLENIHTVVASSVKIEKSDELKDDLEEEEPLTAKQEMSSLVADNVVKKVGHTSTGEVIYEETTVEDGATPRQFIVKDDKIVEYKNGTAGTEAVTAESISDAKEIIDNKKAEEERKAAEKSEREKAERAAKVSQDEAYDYGKRVADLLDDCSTTPSNEREIAAKINEVNNSSDPNYVFHFLKGIYENYDDNENFFEKLEDDCRDSNVSVELRKTFIGKILEAAGKEEFGSMTADNSTSYRELQKLATEFDGKGDFNKLARGGFWGMGGKDYDELFGEKIAAVYKDMKKNKEIYDANQKQGFDIET